MEQRKVPNTTYSNQDSNQYDLPWLLATLTMGLTDVLCAGTNETREPFFGLIYSNVWYLLNLIVPMNAK